MNAMPADAIIIPDSARYWLRQARVPDCFLAAPLPAASRDHEGVPLVDLLIDEGRIAAIGPAGGKASDGVAAIDLAGRQLWPALVDMHVHLDKGHVIPRAVPDGTMESARTATVEDRRRWSRADLMRRMRFGLRCAYAHGVSGMRTHLDSHEGMSEQSWAIFRELRAEWSGRVELQAVSLVPIGIYATEYGRRLADLVARSGGILGGATNDVDLADPAVAEATDTALDHLLRLAAERNLDVDLHVDQEASLAAFTLPRIARAATRNRFQGRVVCDHCVNLVLQPEEVMRQTIALCADAGLSFVTMPMSMVYLQDRAALHTPRWRGVTALHELRAAGLPIAVAGDNCRDAWYPYGDNDMVDTFQHAVWLCQLDHPLAEAPLLVGPVPADICRMSSPGRVAVGAPANLIVFTARTLNTLMCRPQADRIVINRGARITDGLPDHAELDDCSDREI